MDWFSIFVIILAFLVCMRFAYELGELRQTNKQKAAEKATEISYPHKDTVTILDVESPGKVILYQLGKMIWHVYTLDTDRVRNVRMHYRLDDDGSVIDITSCEARQLSRALDLIVKEREEV